MTSRRNKNKRRDYKNQKLRREVQWAGLVMFATITNSFAEHGREGWQGLLDEFGDSLITLLDELTIAVERPASKAA